MIWTKYKRTAVFPQETFPKISWYKFVVVLVTLGCVVLLAKSICFVSFGSSVQVAEGEELTVDYNYPDSVQLPWYR